MPPRVASQGASVHYSTVLVPDARQADTHECPEGAVGRHGPRGGSSPSRRAPRARAVRAIGGVNCVTMCTPDAPRGSRSCRTRTCPARGPLGCGWSPRATRAARPRPARTSRSCRTCLGLVRSRDAPRGVCRGAARASRVLSMRDAGSSYACAAAMHRALRPPQIGMHNGHMPRLGGASGGLWCATRRHG